MPVPFWVFQYQDPLLFYSEGRIYSQLAKVQTKLECTIFQKCYLILDRADCFLFIGIFQFHTAIWGSIESAEFAPTRDILKRQHSCISPGSQVLAWSLWSFALYVIFSLVWISRILSSGINPFQHWFITALRSFQSLVEVL